MKRPDHLLTRRGALTGIAVTATGLALPQALPAQTGYLLPDTGVCALMPETTEGPYYLSDMLVRRDIREDRDGVPVLLRLQVVDPACRPLPEARVDVWHCDAQGIYSSFGGSEPGQDSEAGETFLRGTQVADETGVVEFDTIYPGWYRGRTTHIHYKVWLDEARVLTGQIFLPDALSQYLYENAGAYLRDSNRDTLNGNDGIAARATYASYANVKEEETRYLVQLIVGVSPGAT
ncbi:protocatechuate dioxygenase [Rhodobacterales bacterium HKCCE2091]|nr:protocatechuate dioxygenase [Rhodobacterales bacterium HKCCE2091]